MEFGRVRSLMNLERWEESHREELWDLIHAFAPAHPERFLEQWLPYLRGFPHHFEAPLHVFDRLEALERVRSWLPQVLACRPCWTKASPR